MNDSQVTLNDVRMAAESLAHKLGLPIAELSADKVREHLGRGSKGCLVAYLREVKLECIRAEKCDLYELPVELKSAISNLVEARVKYAEEVIRNEVEITEEAFMDIQVENEKLSSSLRELHAEFEEVQADLQESIRFLEQDHAHARGQLRSADAIAQAAQKAQASLEHSLHLAEENISRLQSSLDEAKSGREKDAEDFDRTLSSLRQKLHDSEKQLAGEVQKNRDLENRLGVTMRKLEELQSSHTETVVRATRAETLLAEKGKRSRKPAANKSKPN